MQPAISFGAFLVTAPVEFLIWWFLEATFELLAILRFFLKAFYHYLGINLILKTFFRPWKNEYREGLVRFATFMGIAIKTILLVFDLIFLAVLVLVEGLVFVLWVALPFTVLWGIYAFIFTR